MLCWVPKCNFTSYTSDIKLSDDVSTEQDMCRDKKILKYLYFIIVWTVYTYRMCYCTIEYHPRNANVVVDALTRMSNVALASMQLTPMNDLVE